MVTDSTLMVPTYRGLVDDFAGCEAGLEWIDSLPAGTTFGEAKAMMADPAFPPAFSFWNRMNLGVHLDDASKRAFVVNAMRDGALATDLYSYCPDLLPDERLMLEDHIRENLPYTWEMMNG